MYGRRKAFFLAHEECWSLAFAHVVVVDLTCLGLTWLGRGIENGKHSLVLVSF